MNLEKKRCYSCANCSLRTRIDESDGSRYYLCVKKGTMVEEDHLCESYEKHPRRG